LRTKTRTSTPRSPASPMQSPEQSTGSPATKGSLVGHGTANPSDLAALRHCCARPGAGSASGTPDTSPVRSSVAVDVPRSDFGDAGPSPSAHATATNTTRAQMLTTGDVTRRPSTRSECPLRADAASRSAVQTLGTPIGRSVCPRRPVTTTQVDERTIRCSLVRSRPLHSPWNGSRPALVPSMALPPTRRSRNRCPTTVSTSNRPSPVTSWTIGASW
jgi:hypothetical protein